MKYIIGIYDQIRPSIRSEEKDNKRESRYMNDIRRENGGRTQERRMAWENMKEKGKKPRKGR